MINKKTQGDKIYFPYLDVVRFAAAFMIIIYHAYNSWRGWFGELGVLSNGTHKEFSFWGNYIHNILENLTLGVDILLSRFFINISLNQ